MDCFRFTLHTRLGVSGLGFRAIQRFFDWEFPGTLKRYTLTRGSVEKEKPASARRLVPNALDPAWAASSF